MPSPSDGFGRAAAPTGRDRVPLHRRAETVFRCKARSSEPPPQVNDSELQINAVILLGYGPGLGQEGGTVRCGAPLVR